MGSCPYANIKIPILAGQDESVCQEPCLAADCVKARPAGAAPAGVNAWTILPLKIKAV